MGGHPHRIAKYDIQSVLGSGAMGIVYKAYDTQIERPVAVKVLHDHLRLGDNGAELEVRFLQEAKAAARCLHPNIVAIFDFGNDAIPYIVMEYVEGTELSAYLKSETFIALHSATAITIQILEALQHAHDKGIVHRDIKPANIILLENGKIKVSDFGVARLDTSDLTGTGYMVGTPNYMSPEGLLGQQVDARSDLYSVGVLFFELLTRSRPLREKDLEQSLEALETVAHLSPDNIVSIRPILSRALQRDPAARYQSVGQFISELKSIEDMDLTMATVARFPRPESHKPVTPIARSSVSSSQWNDELLVSLEQSLARYVGPMARLLVKRTSRSASSIDELVESLTRHIPNEAERSQFIGVLNRSGIKQTGSFNQAPPAVSIAPRNGSVARPASLSDQQLESLSKLLAFYAGPLAGRLVRKAFAENGDREACIAAIAQHIPEQAERAEFLAKAADV
jgi:serine/threonine-protein kinase